MAETRSSTIKIRRGLNLPLSGQPEQSISIASSVNSVALQGNDYIGLRPRMLVAQGERVQLNQPLFIDKHDPEVLYTAPAAGVVSVINRGARRSLQSVVIEADSEQPACADFQSLAGQGLASLGYDDIAPHLYKSGLWTAFRTRPYSKVPVSGSRPDALFITAIDTQPLAADPGVVIAANQAQFQCGLEVLQSLTAGDVYLCTSPDWQAAVPDAVTQVGFAGPHPAGLPGTHIHYLSPVSADRMVWHIGYQDVIAIGYLFAEGRLWTDRIIALGGEGCVNPRLLSTRLGASVEDLIHDELKADKPTRVISGSVLDGRDASGASAWLGRYHLQVTALPERGRRKLFGWLRSGGYSFAGRLRSRTEAPAGQQITTGQYGRPTAMIAINAFDKVMALDMLTVPLLKALLIKDTDQAQRLGCLELAPEDMALFTFVCPGKNDYGAVLRENLNQIERDG
ncbi:MAG: Na(+)-translocating NADH-quinone reductase subunit A [Gammaproteobacteria bacterium]